MQELSLQEATQVSGAGTLIGDLIIGIDNLANEFLNTPLVSSVGAVLFDGLDPLTFGITGAIHQAADLAGYTVFRTVEVIGNLLGGEGTINYHYPTEHGPAPF
jgi:hypothetical protein